PPLLVGEPQARQVQDERHRRRPDAQVTEELASSAALRHVRSPQIRWRHVGPPPVYPQIRLPTPVFLPSPTFGPPGRTEYWVMSTLSPSPAGARGVRTTEY